MHELTEEQVKILASSIADAAGSDLSYVEFRSEALVLLEDVAGFEISTRRVVTKLLPQLWSAYRGQ